MLRTVLFLGTCAVLMAGVLIGRASGAGGSEDRPKFAGFKLAELEAQRAKSGEDWLPFFKVSTLRTGLYVLPAKGVDNQTPHKEDEIYHILRGKAVLNVDGTDHPVEPGAILYVRAGIPHHFHSITEELEVFVFFAG